MKKKYSKGNREHEDIRDDTSYKLDSLFKCQISYYLYKNGLEEVEKSKPEEIPS